jgi:hypothetical protein
MDDFFRPAAIQSPELTRKRKLEENEDMEEIDPQGRSRASPSGRENQFGK